MASKDPHKPQRRASPEDVAALGELLRLESAGGDDEDSLFDSAMADRRGDWQHVFFGTRRKVTPAGWAAIFFIVLMIAIALVALLGHDDDTGAVAPATQGAQTGAAATEGPSQDVTHAGIVPPSCVVPSADYEVEFLNLDWREDVAATPTAGGSTERDIYGGWDTSVTNRGDQAIAAFWHFDTRTSDGSTPATLDDVGDLNNAWDNSWAVAEPGGALAYAPGSTARHSGKEPPLCSFRVVDRLAVVYQRPECLDPIIARMAETEADPTQRAGFMDPIAVDGTLPEEFVAMPCP